MSKVLEIAKKKLSYNKPTNQLYGNNLTPAEIHALIKAGYQPSHDWAVPELTARNYPRPFYFKVRRGEFFQ